MHISIGGTLVASATWNPIYLKNCIGSYELYFPFSLIASGADHSLSAQLHGAQVELKGISDRRIELGYARPEHPISIDGVKREWMSAFILPLSPLHIEEIEVIRRDTDLDFALDIRATAQKGDERRQIDQNVWHQPMPRSKWIDILAAAGAHSSILINVECPVAARDPGRQAIFTLFKSAQASFMRGAYMECISTCRTALEAVQKSTARNFQNSFDLLNGDRRSIGRTERENLIGAAVLLYTHKAHHLDGGQAPEFGPSDAKFVLSTTAAVIQKLS